MKTAEKYKEYKGPEDLPALCQVKDISSYLGININRGYQLMKRQDLKSFKIGNKYLVQKEELLRWINTKAQK